MTDQNNEKTEEKTAFSRRMTLSEIWKKLNTAQNGSSPAEAINEAENAEKFQSI